MSRIVLVVVALLIVVIVGYGVYMIGFANPRIARELREQPDGERAKKVMLLGLPSGREIPVNYLREGDRVFAGADGPWWRELRAGDAPVTVLIRGEKRTGRGRAVLDDPDYTARVFAKLRPNALPGFGTLVEIELDVVPGDAVAR